jgi:hypothetical protein
MEMERASRAAIFFRVQTVVESFPGSYVRMSPLNLRLYVSNLLTAKGIRSRLSLRFGMQAVLREATLSISKPSGRNLANSA